MNAVLRLNLIVAAVFTLVLVLTLKGMLQQANKDISREVTAGISFSHQLLSSAANDPQLLQTVLRGEVRHVRLQIIDPTAVESTDPQPLSDEVPRWFASMIPGLETLQEKVYYRYLDDGRALKIQADPSHELAEVWESVQDILMLFGLSFILSTLAITLGVRQGVKPVADFLGALNAIEKGRYTARLEKYSIKEINELSEHFNAMAEAVGAAEQENKVLTHELMRIQESERSHLARELHDDLGQYLTGIRAQAYLVKQSAHVPELVASVGQQIAVNCDAMQNSFRRLIRELHPVILDQLGLLDAIKTQVENWRQTHAAIDVDLQLPEYLPTLQDESHTHIYRILQESLNNVAQHASADRVVIQLLVAEDRLLLRVSDNGQADRSGNGPGFGLRSMQERARCMQGELNFTREPRKGCEVLLNMPIKEEIV